MGTMPSSMLVNNRCFLSETGIALFLFFLVVYFLVGAEAGRCNFWEKYLVGPCVSGVKVLFLITILILTCMDKLGYNGLGWGAGVSTPMGDELGWGVGLSGTILDSVLAGVVTVAGVSLQGSTELPGVTKLPPDRAA